MKDIYIIMANQNILGFYGFKLDLSIDNSELFDFTMDKSDNVDLIVDVSETFDFILDFSIDTDIDLVIDNSECYDFELCYLEDSPIIYVNPIINQSITYCDRTIETQSELTILTQNGECIQFQF
jgi:hypothetical protein